MIVQPGTYPCRVGGVVLKNDPDGERLYVRWMADAGPHAGRLLIVEDHLGMNPQGIDRTTLVLDRLGFSVDEVRAAPHVIYGIRANVQVENHATTDRTTGRPKSRLRVAFDGVEVVR